MTRTRVRTSTSTQVEIVRVHNYHDPDHPWCVRWRTAIMPGWAFWYYRTPGEAAQVAARMQTRKGSEGGSHD